MRLKILQIRKLPWWTFLLAARHEIIVECDGKIRHFRLYFNPEQSTPFLLLHYCANKCYGLDQFDYTYWDTVKDAFVKQFGSISEKYFDKIINTMIEL